MRLLEGEDPLLIFKVIFQYAEGFSFTALKRCSDLKRPVDKLPQVLRHLMQDFEAKIFE